MGKQKRLASTVHVDGVAYGPDDDVPEQVAKQITNPKAWRSDADTGEDDDDQAEPGTSSGARLAGFVNVDGQPYGPDDVIPDDIAERITNPKAWEGGKLPTAAKMNRTAAAGDDTQGGGQGATTQGDGQSAGPAVLPPPPRSGRGSGEDAWQAWANTRDDLDVPPDAKRADIIAAAEQAGIIDPA